MTMTMIQMIQISLFALTYLYYTGVQANKTLVSIEELARRRAVLEEAQRQAYENGHKISPNSKAVKSYKDALPPYLPISIFGILLGHMLGDCSVKYDPEKNQAYMAFEWSNEAYAYYVYSVLYDYILSPPREQTRVNANGNEVVTYCFQTVTLPCFAIFYHLFIVNGVKTVPTGLVSQLLSPQGLATWYIDDGGLADYRPGHALALQLNTQCFTIDAVSQIVVELNDRYHLNSRIRVLHHKGDKPIIVIPSASYPIFHKIVSPYIHESMAYKLP